MKWLVNFLTSSIGQKLLMSLTGLFLILFLLVHLTGNLQLLSNDGGKAFNIYTDFMSHNPLIQFVAKGNYAFILLHAIVGIMLAFKNKKAKGSKYAVSAKNKSSWASNQMALLGSLIFAFLLMHMWHFWFQLKFREKLQPMVSYDGVEVVDAYSKVVGIMEQPIWAGLYLIGLLVLAFHLWHGFASAFQTLGLRHKKYTPLISGLGKAYAILVPLGFAVLPLYILFTQSK